MAEPQDLILPLLREMRTELQTGFSDVWRQFDTVDARFDRLERQCDDLRKAMTGESVLGRYAAAKVGKRLDAIEGRLATLEKAG
ncbi:hypothetical protein [Methylobacterium pseudosasicola]|uniref:Uncharacterized protein n=1 Tax=Methylobacterium pseudosasicola TaxID=582667 RepID=A0A1I4KC14_9HYPH|nr:hypothetical protein [Methylobacterium pseudosasicola]SFL76260.1 hypothetical protein SAMN05192568_101034 [Methylobacterium pseudosasicola]